MLFLAVVGPGFITANVDNDAGGIYTYSQAGAQFGYVLLWTMIPITIALVVVQEMCARMGAVTGKGLADLIRENFGVRITFYAMLMLLAADLGNTVAEFAGIAASLEIFGLPRHATVNVSRSTSASICRSTVSRKLLQWNCVWKPSRLLPRRPSSSCSVR